LYQLQTTSLYFSIVVSTHHEHHRYHLFNRNLLFSPLRV